MPLSESELILTEGQKIYHLQLRPQDIASTILTVGDPERVTAITAHFDTIECSVRSREFFTQTGTYQGKRLTVISTGIGTDNIDIVLNELDALVNIDFESREIRKEHTPLTFIRIGTSGAIQADIKVDSYLVSEYAVGMDNLLYFYTNPTNWEPEFSQQLYRECLLENDMAKPYVVQADTELLTQFTSEAITPGITVTNVGFYGPQSRSLRLPLFYPDLQQRLQKFRFQDKRITNLEMETSGIYGLSKLLGHRALSLNAILANRATGEFSSTPKKTVDTLIQLVLKQLVA